MTVYSKPGCGKCELLKSRLDAKGIVYDISEDMEYLKSKGYLKYPMVEKDNQFFDFGQMIKELRNI